MKGQKAIVSQVSGLEDWMGGDALPLDSESGVGGEGGGEGAG